MRGDAEGTLVASGGGDGLVAAVVPSDPFVGGTSAVAAPLVAVRVGYPESFPVGKNDEPGGVVEGATVLPLVTCSTD